MAQPGETPTILPGKHGPARSCLSSVCPHVFLPELYARPHVSSSFSCASPDEDLFFFGHALHLRPHQVAMGSSKQMPHFPHFTYSGRVLLLLLLLFLSVALAEPAVTIP